MTNKKQENKQPVLPMREYKDIHLMSAAILGGMISKGGIPETPQAYEAMKFKAVKIAKELYEAAN